MAQETGSLFTKYILTDEEELAGIQFTTEQRMYIQNIIADAAEEKVRLTFDPTNSHLFIQREAELQGTIRTLSNLLQAQDEYIQQLVQSQQSTPE